MGYNIGNAKLAVWIQDKSPFSAQPRQEQAYHINRDNFLQFASPADAYPLPPPINGVRNHELPPEYKGNYLYDGSYTLEGYPGTSSSSSSSSSGSDVGFEAPIAKERMDIIEKVRGTPVPPDEKTFFTWQTNRSLVVSEATNKAPKFGKNDFGMPEFSYRLIPWPTYKEKTEVIVPFQEKVPKAVDEVPIHWGATMTTSLALNQPFEVAFIADSQPIIPTEGAKKTEFRPIFNFEESFDAKRLGAAIYFGVMMGFGTDQQYLFLFVRGEDPYFFRKDGTNMTLIDRFQGFDSARIFDDNNKFFTLKIEPVLGSLIVTSNQFGDTPWIIGNNPKEPIFIGAGPLWLFGGNVAAGWSMRPIQYEYEGNVTTPATVFTIIGNSKPGFTATNKAGVFTVDCEEVKDESEQNSVSISAAANSAFGGGGGGGKVRTILQAESGYDGRGGNVNRKIVVKTFDPKKGQAAGADNSSGDTQVERAAKCTMYSSDMIQGNGYTVYNGRSPYLWSVRGFVPADPGKAPRDIVDISCDVLTVDLTWNATSYNEVVQTGTLRVLMRPKEGPGRGVMNYNQLLTKTTYLRIEAWFENGIGRDPGRGKRNIFTGMITSGTVENTAEKDVVVFKIEDYNAALNGGKFVLSPYYDGMKASLAVRDIMLQLGMPDSRILTGGIPIKNANLQNDLGLPFSNPLQEPKFRFADGTSYKEAIQKFARLHMRTAYFDTNGNFRYDELPGGIFADQNVQVVAEFWGSPIEGGNWGPELRRQAFNMTSFSRNMNDVWNVISVQSVDAISGARISVGTAYKAGIFNPNAVGYLGYRKHLMVAQPFLGSIGAVAKYVDHYRRRIFIPPLTARFEIYGYSGLKPLDIIKLDGQKLRIMNVNISISAAENRYWMNIEGEWFFSAGKGQDPALRENLDMGEGTGSPNESSGSGSSSSGDYSAGDDASGQNISEKNGSYGSRGSASTGSPSEPTDE